MYQKTVVRQHYDWLTERIPVIKQSFLPRLYQSVTVDRFDLIDAIENQQTEVHHLFARDLQRSQG
ncbi:hypothetical protein Pan153_06140 [Gimesia panareensis]|uniref:Uncharacterized protein n=1 Tax=Gimesia panareensis TaxID=2527978 RepID=A0A518FI19_9PLAN|nr:hypothetical protein Pan153_06140 [Gimesia panareensis]